MALPLQILCVFALTNIHYDDGVEAMMMDIQPPSSPIIKQTGFFVEYIGHVGVYE
jgi:hypothetical protein